MMLRLLLSLALLLWATTAQAAVSTTGTPSTVFSTANSSSASVTVPADAKWALVFWSFFHTVDPTTMSTISLAGTSGTILQNGASTASVVAGGVAIVLAPASGTQNLTWDLTGAGAVDIGGALYMVQYFTATGTPSVYTDVVRDSDHTYVDGFGASGSVTLTSATGDYVVGVVQSYSPSVNAVGAPSGSGQTVDVDNHAGGDESMDLAHEDTAGASTTTFSGEGAYMTITAVALMEPGGGGGGGGCPGMLLRGVCDE